MRHMIIEGAAAEAERAADRCERIARRAQAQGRRLQAEGDRAGMEHQAHVVVTWLVHASVERAAAARLRDQPVADGPPGGHG